MAVNVEQEWALEAQALFNLMKLAQNHDIWYFDHRTIHFALRRDGIEINVDGIQVDSWHNLTVESIRRGLKAFEHLQKRG